MLTTDSVKVYFVGVKERECLILYLMVVAAFGKMSHPVADVTGQRTTRHKIAAGQRLISTTFDNMKY